jgi:hypothetical protein
MSSTQEVGDIFGAGKGPAQAMLRSPTVLIVAVGLWGMNVFFFKLFGIDYRYVLTYDLVQMELEEERQRREQREKKDIIDSDNNHSDKNHSSHGGGSMTTSSIPLPLPAPPSSSMSLPDIGSSISAAVGGSTGGAMDLEKQKQRGTPNSEATDETATTTATDITTLTNASHSAAIELQQLQQPEQYGMSITWFKLVIFSVVLLFLLHFTTHFWMDHLGRSSIGAVFSFYGAVVVYIFLPLQSNQWLRRAFVMVVQRSFELINPRCSCIFLEPNAIPRKIPFVDVFYADAMCSLSKVFFDWGMLLHQASHFPNPVPADAHNIVLPSMCAAVPFVIRARQCLIMYTVGRLQQDPNRYQHLANALKYSTSIFPLVLSAYQKTLSNPDDAAKWEGLLIALLV